MTNVINFVDERARRAFGNPNLKIINGGELKMTTKGEQLIERTGKLYQKLMSFGGDFNDQKARQFLRTLAKTKEAVNETAWHMNKLRRSKQLFKQAEAGIIAHVLFEKGVVANIQKIDAMLEGHHEPPWT